MVTVKEKTTVTQRIRGDCPTHSRTEISVRDVRTVIDEPKEREGTNMGPTPTETMVAALIACTNVISHKCEETRRRAQSHDDQRRVDPRPSRHTVARGNRSAVPKNPSSDGCDNGCERGRHGEGKDRSSPLLPDFQGGPQFGHGARGDLERDASVMG